ncbi:MAG TPA: DUF1573 domain-containing protein [Thermogutta sp.]|jgi:hypothetical protein|nr:DUF1573 domain-containing protein [Thermogutta sp.]HPU06648.1 DUF1573 domain-containing protein [Thermogutta sp.]
MERYRERICLASAIVTGLVAAAAAILTFPRAFPTASDNQPDLLKASPPIVSLGRVTEGVYPVELTLVNQSSESLIVRGAHASCDCTEISLQPVELHPGEGTTLKFRWNTQYRSGLTRGKFVIEYVRKSDPNKALFKLIPLESDVLADFIVSPDQIVFEETRAETVTVRIERVAAEALHIKKAFVGHPAFRIHVDERAEIITVSFDPQKWVREWGLIEMIIQTDSQHRPVVRPPIRVQWRDSQENKEERARS